MAGIADRPRPIVVLGKMVESVSGEKRVLTCPFTFTRINR